jgi:hypothetical protein
MRDAITAAIAARLGDVADAAFRLKQAVESGAPATPFSILRMGLDADSAATALDGLAERLTVALTNEGESRP